jgi:hypothetical protein
MWLVPSFRCYPPPPKVPRHPWWEAPLQGLKTRLESGCLLQALMCLSIYAFHTRPSCGYGLYLSLTLRNSAH